jgi:hypothetical protein
MSTHSGVGAWRLPRYYGPGNLPTDPYHHQRVRWAIVGIQRELIRQEFLKDPGTPLTGTYGPGTVKAVTAFQAKHGLVADGLFGPKSATRLWRDLFTWFQALNGIPDNLVYGMCRLESMLDPGAEGAVDKRDRGIAQYNRHWWPSIDDETAFSKPDVCIEVAARHLRAAYDKLGNWDAAVAHHNNPAKAMEWARTGEAPDAQIAEYVALVKKNAAE